MASRTVVIQHPARLKTEHERICILTQEGESSIPLSDVSSVLIDDPQISITSPLLSKCAESGIALFVCDRKHVPSGVFLPYNQYFQQKLRLDQQIAFPSVAAKSIWKRIVVQKIKNQSRCLLFQNHLSQARELLQLSTAVKNGDPDNIEARAAAFYFRSLFGSSYTRDVPSAINASLNYGYTLLRGILARTLTASGLQPALGLHHCSQYNQFNLADDMIEPFRPVVDHFVVRHSALGSALSSLDKQNLLQILLLRMQIGRASFVIDDACQIFCNSLGKCFEKRSSQISGLPVLIEN